MTGKDGWTRFRFVLGQMATSVHLADSAVQQYGRFPDGNPFREKVAVSALQALDTDDQSYPCKEEGKCSVAYTGGLIQALEALEGYQRKQAERWRSDWIGPTTLSSSVLGLLTVQVLLAWATERVLAVHFRRRVSPLLWASLLITTAVVVTVCLRGPRFREGEFEWGEYTMTMSILLLPLVAAAVLAHWAYRPRLAEYRFPPS